MEIFNKIGDTITSKSKDVAKKAKDFTEITQLNSQLTTNKNNLEAYFAQLGKAYHAKFEADYDAQFSEIMNAIKMTQANIDTIEKQIKTIRGVDKCANCGNDVPTNVQFCSTCGAKNDAYVQVSVQKTCSSCNFALASDALFCPNCGNRA